MLFLTAVFANVSGKDKLEMKKKAERIAINMVFSKEITFANIQINCSSQVHKVLRPNTGFDVEEVGRKYCVRGWKILQ